VTAGGDLPPGAARPPERPFSGVDAAVTALLYHLIDQYPGEAASLAAGCTIRVQSSDGKSDHVFQLWIKQ